MNECVLCEEIKIVREERLKNLRFGFGLCLLFCKVIEQTTTPPRDLSLSCPSSLQSCIFFSKEKLQFDNLTLSSVHSHVLHLFPADTYDSSS